MQQVFKERDSEQLIWSLSIYIDGNHIKTRLNHDGKQLYRMELQAGNGEGASMGCKADVENLHYELLDIGE